MFGPFVISSAPEKKKAHRTRGAMGPIALTALNLGCLGAIAAAVEFDIARCVPGGWMLDLRGSGG
jgi:hypothetical protein